MANPSTALERDDWRLTSPQDLKDTAPVIGDGDVGRCKSGDGFTKVDRHAKRVGVCRIVGTG